MKCKICGTRLKDGITQCPTCGAVVGNEEATANIANVGTMKRTTCPTCGKEVIGEHRRCPFCKDYLMLKGITDEKPKFQNQKTFCVEKYFGIGCNRLGIAITPASIRTSAIENGDYLYIDELPNPAKKVDDMTMWEFINTCKASFTKQHQAAIAVPACCTTFSRRGRIKDAINVSGIKNNRLVRLSVAAAFGLDFDMLSSTERQLCLVCYFTDNYMESAIVEVDDGVYEVKCVVCSDFLETKFDFMTAKNECEHVINEYENLRSYDLNGTLISCAGNQARADIDYFFLVDEAEDANIKNLVGDSFKYLFLNSTAPKNIDFEIMPPNLISKGIAKQAGVLAGSVKGVLLLDTTSHLSLGLKTKDGRLFGMFSGNTTIPTKRTVLFAFEEYEKQFPCESTADANRDAHLDALKKANVGSDIESVMSTVLTTCHSTLEIVEGERESANFVKIGSLDISNILYNPSSQSIEITFDIDANGILHVKADGFVAAGMERYANKEVSCRI